MATNQINITLPDEALRIIESRVAAGEYKTPSEVILQALSLLEVEAFTPEDWLREEISARCEQSAQFPERNLSVEQMRQALAEDVEEIRRER